MKLRSKSLPIHVYGAVISQFIYLSRVIVTQMEYRNDGGEKGRTAAFDYMPRDRFTLKMILQLNDAWWPAMVTELIMFIESFYFSGYRRIQKG